MVLEHNNDDKYQDDTYTAVICGNAIARVHLGHLSVSRSALGGRKLVGRTASASFLTFESACRLL